MRPKLIFFDIDGTLVAPGKLIPSGKVIDAVHNAQVNGHKTFLCTGRNITFSEPLLKYGFSGTVSSAGAYILYDGKVVTDAPMTDSQRDHVIKTLHDVGMLCILCAKDGDYAEAGSLPKEFASGDNNSEAERLESLSFLPFDAYTGSPVYSVPFVCPERDALAKAEQELSDEFHICIYSSAKETENINGEIFQTGYDKGAGVKRLCEYLGVGIEDTIGFGDSMNDYEMMQVVQTSVCMAGGSDELKRISTMVCPGVEDDGVAEGLKMLGII